MKYSVTDPGNKSELKSLPACVLTKRPLGKILVDGKFLRREDLSLAVEEQLRTEELLGEVLVRMGLIAATDLKAVLSVQEKLASPEAAVRTAAGVRQMLGNMLLQARRITPEQLDAALEEQKKTGEKLGEVLVRCGFLSEPELNNALAFQQGQEDVTKGHTAFRLGEILVAAGHITREQLNDALNRQKQSQRRLGELLVEAGYAKPLQVEHGLRLQTMLTTAALVAALSLSTVSGVGMESTASAAGSAKITVTATVLPRASLRTLHQAGELVITNADIARGYVAVNGASRIEVKNNSQAGFLLSFEGLCTPFKAVYVQGLGNEVQISSGDGWVPQPYTKGTVNMELSYRFVLAANAEPGTYAWPLHISTLPL